MSMPKDKSKTDELEADQVETGVEAPKLDIVKKVDTKPLYQAPRPSMGYVIVNNSLQKIHLTLKNGIGKLVGIEIPAKGTVVWRVNGDFGADFQAKLKRGLISAYPAS